MEASCCSSPDGKSMTYAASGLHFIKELLYPFYRAIWVIVLDILFVPAAPDALLLGLGQLPGQWGVVTGEFEKRGLNALRAFALQKLEFSLFVRSLRRGSDM